MPGGSVEREGSGRTGEERGVEEEEEEASEAETEAKEDSATELQQNQVGIS